MTESQAQAHALAQAVLSCSPHFDRKLVARNIRRSMLLSMTTDVCARKFPDVVRD